MCIFLYLLVCKYHHVFQCRPVLFSRRRVFQVLKMLKLIIQLHWIFEGKIIQWKNYALQSNVISSDVHSFFFEQDSLPVQVDCYRLQFKCRLLQIASTVGVLTGTDFRIFLFSKSGAIILAVQRLDVVALIVYKLLSLVV